MGVQVSCGIHTKVSEEDRLLGDARGHPRHHSGPVQVERSSDHRGEGDAGSYPSAAVDTAEVFGIQFYGIPEREECNDDLRAARKFEVSIWEPALLGDRILREHSRVTGESDTEVYPRARETEDKVSSKEYENSFKGKAR